MCECLGMRCSYAKIKQTRTYEYIPAQMYIYIHTQGISYIQRRHHLGVNSKEPVASRKRKEKKASLFFNY